MSHLSAYSLAILLHLVAAMVLVGASVSSVYVRRAILEATSIGALRAWLGFAHRSSTANPVAALALLGTGIYLGSRGWWTHAWFYVALASWLANSVLAARVLKPAGAAMGAAMAGVPDAAPVDGRVDALRRSPGWRVAGALMLASDMAMLYVMVLKPSLIESLAVVAGGMIIGGGITLLRARPSGAALEAPARPPRYNGDRDDERAAAGA
ncbi:MAG: hypothetical protein IT179_19075 [Acidobacteria bacterium]|nr:hypothetical protein [Acidobacteriota bacterium]